jgi:carbonic anhydrase
MGGLLDRSQIEKLPAVRSWLCHAESTYRIIDENYTHITDSAARFTATVEENVLVQIEHLRTHPAVAAALGRNKLNLHAWVYKFETGQVFAFSPQEGQFLPVDSTSLPVSSSTHKSSRM